MNIYRLQFAGWDGTSYGMWQHNDNKTQDQFKQDISSIIKKYFDEETKDFETYFCAVDILNLLSSRLSELGYEEFVPITLSYDDPIIIREDDKEIVDLVDDDLFNKIISHNNKIDKQ